LSLASNDLPPEWSIPLQAEIIQLQDSLRLRPAFSPLFGISSIAPYSGCAARSEATGSRMTSPRRMSSAGAFENGSEHLGSMHSEDA